MKSFLIRTHDHAVEVAKYVENLYVDRPMKVTIEEWPSVGDIVRKHGFTETPKEVRDDRVRRAGRVASREPDEEETTG